MSGSIDWLSHLKDHAAQERAELNLKEIQAGDILRIGTRNTVYSLRMIDDRVAELATDRPNRPIGQVKIMGCTFGLSSTISPDHLFCGGNLELTFLEEGHRMTHTTSAIQKLQWIRSRPDGESSNGAPAAA